MLTAAQSQSLLRTRQLPLGRPTSSMAMPSVPSPQQGCLMQSSVARRPTVCFRRAKRSFFSSPPHVYGARFHVRDLSKTFCAGGANWAGHCRRSRGSPQCKPVRPGQIPCNIRGAAMTCSARDASPHDCDC